jgi:hypothetical protein
MAVQESKFRREGDKTAMENGLEPHPPVAEQPSTIWASSRRFWAGVSLPFWIGASRIGLGVIFAHLVVVLLPQSRQHLSNNSFNNGNWLGTFDRWDSTYYTGIAQHGYPLGNAAQTAFFPGYSLLIAVTHAITFDSLTYLQSALAVSWIAFTAASIVLYCLAKSLFGQRVALIATVLFCWIPASLCFISPYSEALFALEILAVLALIERKSFLAAALVAAFASATSPESVALTLALMVAVAMARKGVAWVLLYGAISGAGIVGYMLYLGIRFKDPFEFISVQKLWHRSENFPLVGLYRNFIALRHFFVGPGPAPGGTIPTYSNIRWMWLLDDASLILAGVLTFVLLGMWLSRSGPRHATDRRTGLIEVSERAPIPVSFVVVTSVIVLLAACTTISPYGLSTFASSEGEARFVSVATPIYVAGALLIRRYASVICWVIGASVILALVYQALYNLGYWVT